MTNRLKHFNCLSVLVFLGVVLQISLGICQVTEEHPPEYQVKAAFLYYFSKFVEWPENVFESETSPLIIGVLGADPFEEYLDHTIEGKIVEGRSLEIHRYRHESQVDQCHILFISSSMKSRLSQVLSNFKNKGIITVGDMEGFIQKGGMINFFMKGYNVNFEINVDTAHQNGLKFSSKLLKLAKITHNR